MATLYMTVGVPGSGMNEWAKGMAQQGTVVHTYDEIFRGHRSGSRDKYAVEAMFSELSGRVEGEIARGHDCVMCAENLRRRQRMEALNAITSPCRKVCVLFLTPMDECVRHSGGRLSREAIDRKIQKFECPGLYEGWDEIRPVMTDRSFKLPLWEMQCFPQDNPHHTYSLGWHMDAAWEFARDHGYAREVQIAAAYHDCGKYYTKTFRNMRGETTETAHFYNHEKYGTYIFLLDAWRGNGVWKYGSFEKTLYIALLIAWHMYPLTSWEKSEEARQKAEELIGKDMMDDILRVHEADLAGH